MVDGKIVDLVERSYISCVKVPDAARSDYSRVGVNERGKTVLLSVCLIYDFIAGLFVSWKDNNIVRA